MPVNSHLEDYGFICNDLAFTSHLYLFLLGSP